MRPMIIKTTDIEDLIPLSDFNVNEYKEEEREEIREVIRNCLNKYFYIKLKKPIKSVHYKDSFLIFVEGDIIKFMKLMHKGGHF